MDVIDAAECLAALRAADPGTAWAEPRAILGGWSFWTFEVGDLIVRFPVTEQDADGMERELRLLPELAPRMPVAVPQYTLRGEWRGRPFGAYRRLPGRALDEFGEPAELPPSVWRTLGEALHALHTFPVRVAEHLVGTERGETELFWAAVERDALPLIPDRLRVLAERGIEAHRADGGAKMTSLVHRDLGFVHILSDGERLTGIIDWTDASIADPAKDFVGILARGGWDLVRTVVSMYGEVGTDFEERVGVYAWVAPLHDIIYGLTTDQPKHIAEGIRGLERRMRLAGVIE